jgi:hypothetical protein
MYLEVVKHSWDFYITWFKREIGNIEYQKHKDGETDILEVIYLTNEIGYTTIEYENDKHLKRYYIQIENEYFLKLCSGR